jgi:hypothetical protein
MTEAQVTFVGWIPGKPWDRCRLRQLGVHGRMRWASASTDYGVGAFEHCIVTQDVMERLIREWCLPNPSSFTAVDENNKQLPLWMQKSWLEEWKDIQAERLNHD